MDVHAPAGGFLHTVDPTTEDLAQWPAGPAAYWPQALARMEEHRRRFNPGRLVPLLAPPPHSWQRMMGASSSFEDWHSLARLTTELDLGAIAAHYAQQLAPAGWTYRGGGESGGVTATAAWSAWDVPDEGGMRWWGMFQVLHWPQSPGAYLLELHVMRTGAG